MVSKHLSAFRYGPRKNVWPSTTNPSMDASDRLLLDLSAAREQRGSWGGPEGVRSGIQILGVFLDPKGDPDFLGRVSISEEDFEVRGLAADDLAMHCPRYLEPSVDAFLREALPPFAPPSASG